MGTHTEESLREYNSFMDGYRGERIHCPKCGSTLYNTTLVGYVLVRGKEDEYKDLNRCTCSKCGDRHTFHERVNRQSIRDDSINDILE